ncbi:MAG: L-2-amino-thiazoline-4-carboxylic acid hydrolase [Candidatus Thiodiazotropha sp.]|jgi:hypothetical protein
MKNIIRNIIALLFLFPLILVIYVTTVFFGKNNAIRFWGPVGTFISKQTVRFLVPNIMNPQEFDAFPKGIKHNLRYWKILYDYKIKEETENTFKLNMLNCPFCEVLNRAGLSDLNGYICEGDWAYARENKDKWLFERKYQIGTGDAICDHTYKRIKHASRNIDKVN